MKLDILVPGIVAVLFLLQAFGWAGANVWHQSRFSRDWYGKRWEYWFAPEQRRTTRRIGAFLAGGSYFVGLMLLLVALRAAFPLAREIGWPLEWSMVGIGAVCYLVAAVLIVRRTEK